MSLLIVDSKSDRMEEKTFFFQNQGYQTYWATSAKESIYFLSTHNIELVLANWQLFQNDSELLAICKLHEVALIFYFDNWKDSDIHCALQFGAKDVMIYPFRPTEAAFRLGRWKKKN